MLEERSENYSPDRNLWLISTGHKFMNFCKIENFQDSGKGGQKRNRKYSAVRLTHISSNLNAESALYREQNLNRAEAEKKLKLKLAFSFSGNPITNIRSIVSLESQDYPLWIAFILDELCINGFELDCIIEKLYLSKTKVIKLLHRDRNLWDEINKERSTLKKHKFAL